MTAALNKKVLCFIEEYGTAGAGDLSLGAVLVLARDAGRVDRVFTGLLEPSANEIHATALDDGYLQGLLHRFAGADRLVLINQKIAAREGPGPILYAQAVVETVKVGLKRFQKDVLGRETIGNEVITDQNHHNDHEDFHREIERSQQHDGRFKGVNRVVTVDSAASRLFAACGRGGLFAQVGGRWDVQRPGAARSIRHPDAVNEKSRPKAALRGMKEVCGRQPELLAPGNHGACQTRGRTSRLQDFLQGLCIPTGP